MGCGTSNNRNQVEIKSFSTVTLNNNIYKSNIRWLPRDLKKGEILKITNSHSYGVSAINTTTVTLLNEKSHWFELSNDYLIFN